MFLDKTNYLFTMSPQRTCQNIANPQVLRDNATPSGNGVMAINYAMMFHITSDYQYREALERMLSTTSYILHSHYNVYYSNLSQAILMLYKGGTVHANKDNYFRVEKKYKSNVFIRKKSIESEIMLCQGNQCRFL